MCNLYYVVKCSESALSRYARVLAALPSEHDKKTHGLALSTVAPLNVIA